VGHYHYIRCGDRKIFQAANLSKWKTVNFAIQTLWKTRFIFWCCVHYIQIFDMNFSKHLNLINNFNMMNVENKFIELMNCDKIQIVLAHTLHNFFTPGKDFYET
jgi:hypothetical protein